MHVQIGASVLTSDFANLGAEVRKLTQAGTDFISFDIMDGHFVDTISFGPALVGALRPATSLPFEAHLMVTQPKRFAKQFIDAGCTMLTVHAETKPSAAFLKKLRNTVQVGVAVNPKTPLKAAERFVQVIDLLLVMTVQPGFGGQAFIDQSRKIAAACRLREAHDLSFSVGVDGGINRETAARARAAGANVLVAGSYIARSSDYAAAIRNLRG